jgi:hypothetical protein
MKPVRIVNVEKRVGANTFKGKVIRDFEDEQESHCK